MTYGLKTTQVLAQNTKIAKTQGGESRRIKYILKYLIELISYHSKTSERRYRHFDRGAETVGARAIRKILLEFYKFALAYIPSFW